MMRAGSIDPRPDPEDWVLGAACRGRSDLFFPPDVTESRSERRFREERAKALCAGCVVRVDCLNEALVGGERFGIWGGLNERERRAVARGKYGSPQDIAGPGRLARLPAVVVRGRQMSFAEDT